MLSSKANAALVRLKEIEEKYKIKRKEQKWNRKEDTDSSISSVSIISSENLSTGAKGSSKNVPKHKLNIKMPHTRFEEYAKEAEHSSESKKSMSNEISPKALKNTDKVNLDVAISPLKDKSSRSSEKQESFISDVTTIQENSSIESVLDDSVTSSKSSLSRAKTSERNLANNKFFKHKGRRKAVADGSEMGNKSDKSYEVSKEELSSDNSIARLSKKSEKSNDKISKAPDPKSGQRSFEERAIVKMPEATSLNRNSYRLESSRDNSAIVDRSIGTVEDGSEIISELSRSEESAVAQNENSDNVSKYPKYSISQDISTKISNSSKYSVAKNEYANDTFENISSSPMRSKSASERENIIGKKKEMFDPTGSNTKQIDIAPQKKNGSYRNSAKSYRGYKKASRDGQVIGSVASKSNATETELESSNYVSDFESTSTNNTITRLIKLSKLSSTRSEKRRKRRQRRTGSFEGNIRDAASSDKNLSDSSDIGFLAGDTTKTDVKKNSSEIVMTFVRQESVQKERKKTSNKTRERAIVNVTESPTPDKDRIESVKSNSSVEGNEEGKENVLKDQRIAQDDEAVLKKLHRDATDALAKRRASSKTAEEASECSSDGKTEREIPDITRTREATARKENKSCRSSERNKVFHRNGHERNTDRKKERIKVVNSKLAEVRNSVRSRKESKTLRFDRKQMRGLRKRIIELQLQQERENLQKYLHELKDLRSKSNSSQNYFSPLEFPKIAEFTQPDTIDLESTPGDHCVVHQERVSTIRRWLKEQYILYRDYCTMAQAINAHYVPTTLEDAKMAIRELRKTRIKTR